MNLQTVSQGWIDQELCGNAALGCLAAVSAATDLYCGKIYNMITVPGLCLGILLAASRAGAPGILEVLCAAGFTVLVLFPFYSTGGLGAGDIKLLAAISAFMSAESYLHCFAGAFILGAAAGVGKLFFFHVQKQVGKDMEKQDGQQIIGHRLHFAVPVALSVLLHLMKLY